MIEAMKSLSAQYRATALRLPAHSHLPAAPGAPARLAPNASTVAPGGVAAVAPASAAAHRQRSAAASACGQCERHVAYDFVFDACADADSSKCLTLVDEFTHECLAIDVAGSIRSKRVIDVLARMISVYGAPLFLRSDNGPEFVSPAILRWLAESGVGTALIDPGKPWQNGTNDSFNAACATSACRGSGSARAPKPPSSSRLGDVTTTPCTRSSLNYLTPQELKQQDHHVPTEPSSRNEWLAKAGTRQMSWRHRWWLATRSFASAPRSCC